MTRLNAKLVGSTFLVLCAAGGAGLMFSSSASADAAATAAKVGAPAPLFELKDQSGKTVRLDDYRDKVVVLEWFNNECPYVVKHYKTSAMNQTAEKYKAKDVVWLAIDSTNAHDASNSQKIAGEWKIDRPILTDKDGTVGHQYGAKTTPHMYVINKGTLVYAGAIDDKSSSDAEDIASSKNYVAAALDEVLAGKAVSTQETKPYGCSVKYAK